MVACGAKASGRLKKPKFGIRAPYIVFSTLGVRIYRASDAIITKAKARSCENREEMLLLSLRQQQTQKNFQEQMITVALTYINVELAKG